LNETVKHEDEKLFKKKMARTETRLYGLEWKPLAAGRMLKGNNANKQK